MSRPRRAGNKDLPPNLYRQKKGRRTYYIYRRPDTRAATSLGSNQAEACRAARLLNGRLLSSPRAEQLASRVLSPKQPLTQWIAKFSEALPKRRNRRGLPLAEKTVREYTAQLRRLDSGLGAKDVAQVTRRDVAQFLEPFPPTYRNRMRSLMNELFAHAVAEGLRDDNPVTGTLKAVEVVARGRLPKEVFARVYEAAPEWLQRAMTMAIVTLQRRSDLVQVRHEHYRSGFLYVVQHKTGAHLRIPVEGNRVYGNELKILLEEPSPVPEVLWWPGERGPRKLTAERLSRTFAEVRDQVAPGLEHPPTFHEIRALGARLYRDAGIDPQALLGHADAATTRWYLDRHEVRWTEVEV